jgi:predicted SAM-dependent methyltransferase
MATPLVFAADTLVRFRSGRILIHTTSSTLPAFQSEHPMLIGWLCQFARPTDAEASLQALRPTERETARQVIDYLRRSGVLVAPDAPEASERNEAEQTARIKNHLKLLARSVYDTACDLHGLGPQAEQALIEQTGVGVERRLMALLAAVDGLRSELRSVRDTHIVRELARLGLTADTRNLKLHIGCGPGHLKDWVNIDIHPAPLSMNVLWGLPFKDGSAQYVFLSHMLEHLFFPRDVRALLAEVRRVLAPGGVVRIVVPDIEQCIAAYVTHDRAFFESRRETWSWWPENPTRLEDFLAYAGAGPEPAYLFESHKYGYDFETLQRVLTDEGFTSIVRSQYMQSAHELLRVDDVSAVARATYGDRHYSLFVEAFRNS